MITDGAEPLTSRVMIATAFNNNGHEGECTNSHQHDESDADTDCLYSWVILLGTQAGCSPRERLASGTYNTTACSILDSINQPIQIAWSINSDIDKASS